MAEMTPAEAAAVLRRAEGYEQALTNRTAGMTNMVWGLAAAVIFLTYGSAADWLVANQAEWGFALLWIPGVAFGSVFTAVLWHGHAVTLHARTDAKQGMKHMVFSILGFFALAAVVVYTLRLLDFSWTVSTAMTIVNGFFAFAMARVETHDAPLCAHSTYAAGALILAGGIAMGLAGLGDDTSALVGAAVTGVGWGGAGLWTVVRS